MIKSLKIKERLVFPALLPDRGNIIDLTLSRDMRDRIALTQKEMADTKFECVTKDGKAQYKWDDTKDTGTEIDFSDAEMVFLRSQIDIFDKAGSITPEMLELCLLLRDS